MPNSNYQLPNRLCVKDGKLRMRDGSKVQDYLRGCTVANAEEVVILPRANLIRLLKLAEEAENARIQRMTEDERFALAA